MTITLHISRQYIVSTTLSSFFFLMIPRPPRSTLFPYTTLFRSARAIHAVFGHDVPVYALKGQVGNLGAAAGVVELLASVLALDRKSTRLNSSHVEISYAVFCLKKKKKNNNQYAIHV